MYKILMCGLGNNYGGVEAYIMSVFRNINKEIFHIDFINCQKTEDIVCHDEINSFNCKIFRLYGKKAWKVFFKQHKGEYDAIIFNLLATFFQPIELCVRWGRLS